MKKLEWYQHSIEEVFSRLQTSAAGLADQEAKRIGIKNAQIEAPGTKFIQGMIYTIKIEHDGGLRIDSQPIPPILKDEKIKS